MENRNTVSSFIEDHFNLVATLGIFLAVTASANQLAHGMVGQMLALAFCGVSLIVWLELLAQMGEPQGGTLLLAFLLLSGGMFLPCFYELKVIFDGLANLAWLVPWFLLLALAGVYVDRVEAVWRKWGLPRTFLVILQGLYLFGAMAACMRLADAGHVRIVASWVKRAL